MIIIITGHNVSIIIITVNVYILEEINSDKVSRKIIARKATVFFKIMLYIAFSIL